MTGRCSKDPHPNPLPALLGEGTSVPAEFPIHLGEGDGDFGTSAHQWPLRPGEKVAAAFPHRMHEGRFR